MGKVYKHKKLGWIANKLTERNGYSFADDKNPDMRYGVSLKLLEEDDNRELQEEKKDWIDKMFSDGLVHLDFEVGGELELIRKHLEKYMPKISEEELNINVFDDVSKSDMRNLLKEKGLYEE